MHTDDIWVAHPTRYVARFFMIFFAFYLMAEKLKGNTKRQNRENETSTRNDNDEHKTHKSVVSLTRL